ncbi:lipoprotein [Mycoavidus sp. B2-EB]|nr:lipoprotein [Mycoavidus sp. B2-EB]
MGCSTVNEWFSPDRVDYKNAKAAPSLTVPADLAPLQHSENFSAPSQAKIESLGTPEQRAQAKPHLLLGRTQSVSLRLQVEADDDQRWLVVVGYTPTQLWPLLRAFWSNNGFRLTLDRPEMGLMETDWAENRAQMSNDWLRRTLGQVADKLYSSGMRDRFRMLVEHNANGTTSISITHRGMEEVLIGRFQESSRWQDRARNAELETALLKRLIEQFGLTAAQAEQLNVNARRQDVK